MFRVRLRFCVPKKAKLSLGFYKTAEAARAAYLISWHIKNRPEELPKILEKYKPVMKANLGEFVNLMNRWKKYHLYASTSRVAVCRLAINGIKAESEILKSAYSTKCTG